MRLKKLGAALDGDRWARPGYLFANPGLILRLFVAAIVLTCLLAAARVYAIQDRPFMFLAFANGDGGCYKVAQTLQETTFLLRAPSGYSGGPGCADNVRVRRGDGAEREVVKTADIRSFELAEPPKPREAAPDTIGPGLADIAAAIRGKLPVRSTDEHGRPEGLIVNQLTKNDLAEVTANSNQPVYWKEFKTGEFSLPREANGALWLTKTDVAEIEARAQKAISANPSPDIQWRPDESGRLDVVPINGSDRTLESSELVTLLANLASDDPVQVIGFADARGATALNSALAQYRAIAMKIILESAATSDQKDLKFQLCFAGEKWDGANRKNAESTPWLRRVEIRYGGNRINVLGCEHISSAKEAPGVAAANP